MSEALERGLEELVPRHETEPRRWDEVLRRASVSHSHRRRVLAISVAAALAIVVATPALGLHREFVDFFSAEPAPEPIRIDFARMRARAQIGFGPHVVAEEARQVMSVPVDGKERPLWVAPIEGEGFCYRWHTSGSCGRMPHQQDFPRKLAVGWLEGPHGPQRFLGHVLDPAIDRLELRYADGERVDLPFVWVSPPIDAGFVAFQVPEDHQQAGHGAVEVVAFDGKGNEVERHVFPPPSDPQWEAAADGLPRIADRTKKRTLFDFRDESGARWTLTVAPAPGEKLCYAFNRGGGCRSPKFPSTPLSVQGGGKTAFVCCTVPETVTKVELLFQDGDRIEVEPVEGFVLYAVPSEHYPRGRRLEAIVSRDASGHEVERVKVKAGTPGLYPCKKTEEIDLGVGQTICP